MKKLIIFGLIFCLLSSFIVACGSSDSDTGDNESEVETVTITLKLKGGKLSRNDKDEWVIEKGEKQRSLPTPEKSGYEFIGWFNQETDEVFAPGEIYEDTIFYAKWQEAEGADTSGESSMGSDSDSDDVEESTETDSDVEIDTESNTSTEVESETETESETEIESDSETETETESDSATETETETETEKEEEEKPVIQKQDWREDGVLKILAIGNSFSDDAMEYVYQVAKDAGVQKISLGNMYIGGCTLATHLSNAKGNKNAYTYRTNTNGTWSSKNSVSIKTAVESENWDFITFQQASGYSGIASTYDDLNELISIVEPLCPGARLAWHMTWAYKEGSTHSDFPKYDRDQMTMYNAIVESVNTKILTNDKIEIIIPSGTSVQNLRTSYIGDVTRDGYHLDTGIGRYLASMTYVKALTGLSIDNSITRPNNVDGYELVVLIDCVNNALSKPYEITNSQYQDKDEIEISENIIPKGYVQLTATQMGLTEASFYLSSSNDNLNSGTDGWYKGFMATKKFTREELPVGSIIEIAEGWQYRPEGWNYTGTRPANVTIIRIVIDEDWWGSYTERGFNISQTSHTSSKNNPITISTDEVANTIFKIIVPESAVSNN